jgi:hypothetical protein
MSKGQKQTIGPMKTLEELRSLVEQPQPQRGQPPQSPDDEFKYSYSLEGTWGNAEWAKDHNLDDPNPYFDRKGYEQNEKLKRKISDALIECKKIDLTDPNGPEWFVSWRMYPNKNHPRWQTGDCCGCNCGCLAPWNPDWDK